MTTPWTPPRRSYHLRIFAVALALVVAALIGVLFGLHMEALAHANGILEAEGQEELRSPRAGVLEMGWWEGEVQSDGVKLAVRVDAQGNGCTIPTAATTRRITRWKLANGPIVPRDGMTHHKAQAGDTLWPSQPLACVVDDELIGQRDRMEARLADEKKNGTGGAETSARLLDLNRQLEACSLTAPVHAKAWLAAKVLVEHRQAVKAGEATALLVPCDPTTREPLRFNAVLHVDEKHAAYVEAGQEVRLFSLMFGQRLFGHADGILERIEPQAEAGAKGGRYFKAHVRVTQSPFPLRLGSSVSAEIVVGRKQIVRVILEH